MSKKQLENKKPEPRRVGYGLPCAKCNTYYFADLKACPVCRSTERAIPAPRVLKPVTVEPAKTASSRMLPGAKAEATAPRVAQPKVRLRVGGLLGECWSIIIGGISADGPESAGTVAAEHTVAARDFTAQCDRLLDQVSATGEPIVVTRMGRPLAKIVPAATA